MQLCIDYSFSSVDWGKHFLSHYIDVQTCDNMKERYLSHSKLSHLSKTRLRDLFFLLCINFNNEKLLFYFAIVLETRGGSRDEFNCRKVSKFGCHALFVLDPLTTNRLTTRQCKLLTLSIFERL